MLISQTLSYARVLLASGWCQGAEARDERDVPVAPWDALAHSWSLLGAILAVASDAESEIGALERPAASALAFALEIPATELRAWNDEPRRSKQEVLAACDHAIELLPRLVAKYFPAVGEAAS